MARANAGILLLCITALSAHAGVIRGIVTEQRTGYVLSRAQVTLEALPGTAQQMRTARTGENGQFAFVVPAGSYLLKATRRGFMPVQYGQRRWDAAGTAIVVGDETVTVNVRMPRYGAITGIVRDANEVGIPDQDVVAYTNALPPVYAARGKSDERGVFRIGGLEPGSYLVRTTGNYDEDRSYLPTFSRQTLRVEEARTATVYPDEDTPDGDIRPVEGRLFSLSGFVPQPPTNEFVVTITIVSDLGRTTTNGTAFQFPGLAPGHYELFAEARENPPGTRVLGGYTDVLVERNITNFALPLNDIRNISFVIGGAGPQITGTALVRRRDYAGTGPAQTYSINAMNSVPLMPGRWETRLIPPAGFYVSGFGGPQNANARADGWNEFVVNSFGSRANFTVAGGPAALHGAVRYENKPAAGAPVFLEGWDPITRVRQVDLRETRTDVMGNYRFDNLAPGEYRVLSTFEYAAPSPQAFDALAAVAVRLEKASDRAVDLELEGSP
jgi:hypothetical protein